LAQAIEAKQPQATGSNGALTWDDLDRDPVLGLLTKRLRDAEQQYKAHEQRLAMHEQRYLQERYTEKLNTFKFADETDKRQFLDFAIQNQITNLDVAHKAYTADRAIQTAAKEAELRGVERGRKEASAPIPIGSRRSIAPDAPPPKTLDEAHDRALNDPEIWAAMRGETPG
jgi:hypothetical protein